MHLSSITKVGVINAGRMILLTPFAIVLRIFRKKTWIITERSDQARDNGFIFFKYMKEHHPEQPVYYVIEKNAPDYNKIRSYGNIIQFNSWKHFFYFCFSSIHISAHVRGCNPDNNPMARRLKRILGYKDVFLPHGVSYGVSEFCLAKYSGVDLFICSGRLEYDNVLKNYGYRKNQVAYTGFPRLDEWHDLNVDKKKILLMPTWRLYLAQNPNTVFEETLYYEAYQKLINNQELANFLGENGLKLIFYVHHNMRKYVNSFMTNCPDIEIVYRDETYDIQDLLKSAGLLITDYSSVHFDFAYMQKPVIYYQFDRKEFWEKQYKKGDFDAEKDGFGPVAYDLDNVLKDLKDVYDLGFRQSELYHGRMRSFYQKYDKNNSDRVYKEIKNHFK